VKVPLSLRPLTLPRSVDGMVTACRVGCQVIAGALLDRVTLAEDCVTATPQLEYPRRRRHDAVPAPRLCRGDSPVSLQVSQYPSSE
jgi:hypothetical protein